MLARFLKRPVSDHPTIHQRGRTWRLVNGVYVLQGAGPNVVFQDGAGSTKPGDQGPTPDQMQAWDQGWRQTPASHGAGYTVTKSGPVTLYTNCASYSRR